MQCANPLPHRVIVLAHPLLCKDIPAQRHGGDLKEHLELYRQAAVDRMKPLQQDVGD